MQAKLQYLDSYSRAIITEDAWRTRFPQAERESDLQLKDLDIKPKTPKAVRGNHFWILAHTEFPEKDSSVTGKNPTYYTLDSMKLKGFYPKTFNVLSHQEIQRETHLRFYLTLARMATIKETTKHAVEDVGGEEPLFTASRGENWYSHYGLSMGFPQQR